jgi:glucosylceramidase
MNQWQSKHGNHVFIRQRKSVILSYLGPTLKNAGLGEKITVWDHNRDLLSQRASTILDDPQASNTSGEWFHWYESWSGGDPMFDNVGKVHEMYPDKNLLLLKVEKFDYLSCSVGQTGSVMENP